jgi:hypothetical protein
MRGLGCPALSCLGAGSSQMSGRFFRTADTISLDLLCAAERKGLCQLVVMFSFINDLECSADQAGLRNFVAQASDKGL